MAAVAAITSTATSTVSDPATDQSAAMTTSSASTSLSPDFQPPELPSPFKHSTAPIQLIAHGAEALLYKTIFLDVSRPCVLKHRPPKTWRHPTLDARLTRHRILSEARILVRCRREHVSVPAVLALDADAGWLCTEFVGNRWGIDGQGITVRDGLERWKKAYQEFTSDAFLQPLRDLLSRIGQAVASLHAAEIVHGDLTSSNLMLRNGFLKDEHWDEENILLTGEVVLIDFGLAMGSTQEEDRAVDLYVLERAMGSTHPWLEDEFGVMLEGYKNAYKGAHLTLRRLEVVRQRGRKKSMIG